MKGFQHTKYTKQLLWLPTAAINTSGRVGANCRALRHHSDWTAAGRMFRDCQQKNQKDRILCNQLLSPLMDGFKNDNNQENLCRTSTCPKKMSTNEVDQSFASQAILVLHCCYEYITSTLGHHITRCDETCLSMSCVPVQLLSPPLQAPDKTKIQTIGSQGTLEVCVYMQSCNPFPGTAETF